MYFVRHGWVVAALKATKGPKFGQNEGQKYKIVDFEDNLTFGLNKWLCVQNNTKSQL